MSRFVSQTEKPLPEAQSGHETLLRDSIYRRLLACADVLSAGFALILGVVVLGDDRLSLAVLAATPMVVLVSKVIGLYDRDEHLVRKSTLDEVPALFQVATLYTLLVALSESVFVEGHLGRDQLLGVWGLLFLSMALARTLARRLGRRIAPPERCFLLGDAVAEARLRAKLDASHSLSAVLVGTVPLEESLDDPRAAALAGRASLPVVLEQEGVERVIIAPTRSDSDQVLHAIRLVKAMGVKVSLLPRLFEVVGSSVAFDDIDGLTLLGVPRYGLSKSSRALKRAMDVVGSLSTVIVLSPLLVTIAALIKFSSRGPVLFRQTRVGRGGAEFQMLKFRTMVEGADEQKADLLALNEADGLFKIANDPRMTRVGRILRWYSLDELPQLLNVLRGDMSLVGPRPLVVEDDQRVEGWQRRRLDLTPGMTGVWQILGSARIPLHEMVKLDYLYGANWSLWFDVKILLRTVPYVLGRRGL